jgi:hypothetical protein
LPAAWRSHRCRRDRPGCGELGAEVVVLRDHAVQLGLDLVQELVDLTHVVALAEPTGVKRLLLTSSGVSGMTSPDPCSSLASYVRAEPAFQR